MTLVAAINNATIIYDDLYLLEIFNDLSKTRGVLHTIYYLFFNIDLGHSEFRLYGISRVLHFILWIFFGNNAIGYTIFIAWTQVLTGYFISRIIARLGYSDLQALYIGLIWALSPFSATSCFHHYSYLILPWQIAIFNAFLIVNPEYISRWRIVLFCILGSAIALTGESHLAGTSIFIFMIAITSTSSIKLSNRLLQFYTTFFSTIATIIIYKYVRSPLLASSTQPHRYLFSAPSFEEFCVRSSVFMESIVAGVTAQISPLLSIAGGWAFISFIGALCLIPFIKIKNSSTQGAKNLQLPIFLALIFISSLSVIWMLSVFTGQVSAVLPRRYGYIPYTIGIAMVVAFLIEPYIYKRVTAVSIAAIIIPLWLWITLQGLALPMIRKEDNHVWQSLKNAIADKKAPSVLFVNAWLNYEEPTFVLTAGTPGLRGVTPEIFESALSGYWWQSQYATLLTGAKFAAGRVVEIEGKVHLFGNGLLSHPESLKIPREEIIIIENTAKEMPEWKTAIQTVKVSPSYDNTTWKYYKDSPLLTSDLTGKWGAGIGIAQIEADSTGALTLKNENGNIARGIIIGNAIVCDDWKVTGKLTRNGNILAWSNGFKWERSKMAP